jgi:hypothetical protein
LQVLAGSSERAEADRTRAVLLTLSGWSTERVPSRNRWRSASMLPTCAVSRAFARPPVCGASAHPIAPLSGTTQFTSRPFLFEAGKEPAHKPGSLLALCWRHRLEADCHSAVFWAGWRALADSACDIVREQHPDAPWASNNPAPAVPDLHVVASGPGSGKTTAAKAFMVALTRAMGEEPFPNLVRSPSGPPSTMQTGRTRFGSHGLRRTFWKNRRSSSSRRSSSRAFGATARDTSSVTAGPFRAS